MLLDTDVLIDLALDRRPHSETAAALLDRIEATGQTAFIAWHTVANFHYLVSPSRGRKSARNFIAELTCFIGVAAGDAEAVRYAASLPMKDFEDAMQVAAARSCGASRIVTRNVRDYQRSPIPAITPAQALSRLPAP
ncbi:MAG: PIN domain-containing protein [Gammaproteobacteria bacterium]|nr:PIN domain-containing protein [Gammaproteobacteria bacterium]MYD01225.1 PIN domain-containing protein [Gammaproteobacteria bacterium]